MEKKRVPGPRKSHEDITKALKINNFQPLPIQWISDSFGKNVENLLSGKAEKKDEDIFRPESVDDVT